ncbi:ABC transporter ATP-binding protein [bacterium]|nr:ABC transporter ATP-binding protein [bacterium]
MKDRILISVRNLRKYFPRGKALVHAVEDVSFNIRKGETLGLVGESGCGKSTVARLILRLINPDGGNIIFDGIDITNISEKALKPFRRRMQIVFQDPVSSLNPQMTVGTIIKEQFAIHNMGSKQEREKWVEELLERVGIDPNFKDAYPHEFSGGQQQRICIARAIALKSEFIVCDEPLSALDVSVQAQIIKLLEELQRELGLTYLFISHDLAVVKHLSNSIAVMYLGKVVEYAEKEELFGNPLHPYTITLLSSVPSLKGKEADVELKGEPPNPINPPEGCPFNPRCPSKVDICEREIPTLEEVSKGHFVACHIVSDRR